jgi:membrane protein implicated in regulation of membrane protease activity
MSVVDSPAVAWLIVAIVAAIVEVSIPTFGVIFVGLAAVIAAAAAWFDAGVILQWAVFVAALALSLLLLRPRLAARLSGGRGVPTRTEPLIGREGIVTHDIEASVGAGRINVGGEDWAARAPSPLAAGTRVRVVGADGIVLEVTKA